MDNSFKHIKAITSHLIALGISVKREFGAHILGFYIYGSIVRQKGKYFSEKFSDIDLLLVTSLSSPSERADFLVKLKPLVNDVEMTIRVFFPKRHILPILNICLATKYEVSEGIHMSRNSRITYRVKGYVSLLPDNSVTDSKEFSNQKINVDEGGFLHDEMLRYLIMPGWTILADIQEHRSNFILPQSVNVEEVEKANANDETDYLKQQYLITKELLRTAYILHYLKKHDDPIEVIFDEEDDLMIGFNELKTILKEDVHRYSKAEVILGYLEQYLPDINNQEMYLRPEQELYLWELISVATQKCIENARYVLSNNSLKHAADIVIQELISIKATSMTAVDTAVILGETNSFTSEEAIPVLVKQNGDIERYSFTSLDRNNLILLASEWPEDIERYLRECVEANRGNQNSECKVGFSGYDYTQGPPILRIRPLTYWITQQFNKEIALRPTEKRFKDFRDKYGSRLFKPGEDFVCECPSSLYLETAVVTSDQKVPILLKKPSFSVMGMKEGQSIQTCGIEYGLIWHKHVEESANGHKLKIKNGLFDGLFIELGIKPVQVEHWEITALCIQHVHLNAALLGVVYLNIDAKTFENVYQKHIEEINNKGFFDKSIKFIDIKEAHQAVVKDKGTGRWHQTALMRLNLIKDK